MKRKVVQHGPTTLTVSLPKQWATRNNVQKGDEVTLEQTEHSLSIRLRKQRTQTREISVKGMSGQMIHKAISALYKSGHDDIVLHYARTRELKKIHYLLRGVFIGYEIIEEKQGSIRIKKVSMANGHEFRTLFRRIFHFTHAVAEDSLLAAKEHDKEAYDALQLRDLHIDRLANFCRRIVYTQGQQDYDSDIALYYIIEQVEKVADIYRDMNRYLMDAEPLPEDALHLYGRANELLKTYTDLFFSFKLDKVQQFMDDHEEFRLLANSADGPGRPLHLIRTIARELSDTLSIVMMLHI